MTKTVKCTYLKNSPGPLHYYTFKTDDDVKAGDVVWTRDSTNGHWLKVDVAYVDQFYDSGAEDRLGKLEWVYLSRPVSLTDVYGWTFQ